LRRHYRALVIIIVLVILSSLILGFRSISIGDFKRGGDNPLGLELGLDLQGGSHLVYRAASETPPSSEDMEGLRSILERRVNSMGLGEPIIQLMGDDRILIQLPGVRDPQRAKELIGETARLEFKLRKLAQPGDAEGITDEDIVSVRLTTLDTLDEEQVVGDATTTATSTETGTATTTEALDETESDTSTPVMLIEFTDGGADKFATFVDSLEDSFMPLPGTLQYDENGEIVPGTGSIYPDLLTMSVEGDSLSPIYVSYYAFARTSDLRVIPLSEEPLIERVEEDGTTFKLMLLTVVENIETAEERFGLEPKITIGETIGKVDEDVGLTGDDLARAYPGQLTGSGVPVVYIDFNSEGAKKFGEVTSNIAGTSDLLAIVLDGDELIAPGVERAIVGGSAYIRGNDFTIERVRDLAILLESGRLPIPIELIQERDVDAILGSDSLAKSIVAGAVGLALVLLFMIMYYRVPGVVAAVALIIYGALVLSIFKMLPVTLTLSGVAAAILSIGMAVDANILIFERMKDELRAGRTLLSAINIGFNRAWPAIRDSNISTLITCAILFWFADTLGATIVKGFAITLSIGVATSMFSAITVSRTFLRMLVATPLSRRLGWFVPVAGDKLPQQTFRERAV